MLTDLELMKIHVSALFIHDAGSRLLFINEPDGLLLSAPRLFLGRTREGNVWRFHTGLSEKLCGELEQLCADEPPLGSEFNVPPRHLQTYVRLLEANAPVQEISSGPAYWFAEFKEPSKSLLEVTENEAEVLQGGFEDLVGELPAWQPFIALILETKAVSVCRSVRITSTAHEAGVETLPDFRGRDYAQEVTAEWARRVLATGTIPLYSTDWRNQASQAVARKLGLKCYGTDFHIT